MKISYRTHPILEKIDNGKLFNGNSPNGAEELYEKYKCDFQTKTDYISEPFADAVYKSFDKVRSLLGEMLNIDARGTIIYRNSVTMFSYKRSETVSYTLCIFCFDKLSNLHSFFYKDGTGQEKKWLNEGVTEKNIYIRITMFSMFSLFKKFASVETILLPPGKKVRAVKNNHLNGTRLNITLLDSKWFTTFVKSEAFKVRGHFRLQPKKKEGEWTKELIWINDFTKEGYTAPARKLNEKTH